MDDQSWFQLLRPRFPDSDDGSLTFVAMVVMAAYIWTLGGGAASWMFALLLLYLFRQTLVCVALGTFFSVLYYTGFFKRLH